MNQLDFPHFIIREKIFRIFLRLLMIMYRLQFPKVFWDGNVSEVFSLRNGG